jgi:hypothetical protein
MPLALVERNPNFDKNPRLANGRGFFIIPACGFGSQPSLVSL